jgi:hypothetical protein
MAGECYKAVLQAEVSGDQKSQSFQRLRERVVSLHPLQTISMAQDESPDSIPTTRQASGLMP